MTQQIFTDSVAIQGSQDTTQLVVKGNVTQTQPLQNWLDNAGNLKAQVTGDGRLQIGNNLGAGAPADALIQANNDLTLPSALPTSGWHTLGRLTGALSSAVAWVVHELQLLGTGGVSGLQTAMRAKLTHSNTGTSTSAELRAIDAQTINQGGTSGAAVGQATGLRATASNAAGAYLAKAVGVEAALTNDTSGSLTQATGFSVVPATNAGSIGTLTGLQIADLVQGATNYAIYTGQGQVRLGDQLAVIGSGDKVQTIVRANTTQHANLQEWQDSDGTVFNVVDNTGLVGLGTSSPISTLDVRGTTMIGVTDTSQLDTPFGQLNVMLPGNSGTVLQLGVTSNGNHAMFGVRASDDSFYIQGSSNNAVSIASNASLDDIYITLGHDIGIATTTPQGKFHIKGTSDERQFIVQANATQTANLQEWRNSSGTVLSAVDKSANLGIQTSTPNSALQVNGPIATTLATKTAAYTITAADSIILGNATSGAITITLPTAVGCTGRAYTVKKIDSSANAVTVATTSSQTIDGATTKVLSTQYAVTRVVSNGSNWLIV